MSPTSGCSWAVFLLVRSRRFLLWFNILLPADGIAHPLHTVRYQEERRINLIESPLREMVTEVQPGWSLVHGTCCGLQDKDSIDHMSSSGCFLSQ